MIAPTTSSLSPLPYKDRKTGLIIFGVLTMGIGVVVALFIPLMIFSLSMAAKESALGDMGSKLIPAVAIYGVLAVALIWLGIGSTMARRWARALLLIFSWCWLIMGVLSVASAVFIMPRVLAANPAVHQPGQAQLPASAQTIILAITLAFYALIFVLLPAIWVWFYQSKNVKATCEARDPVRRWTDRCPLPVLAISLWLGVGALMMLVLPFALRSVLPFFGMFVSGTAGTILYILIAFIWAYAAWTTFKLQLRGWWLAIITFCVFNISSVITYFYHDIREMYRLVGYPEKQIAMIEQLGFFKGNVMAWSCLMFAVPFIAYLLFIRRYFQKSPSAL
jgi:MFS family permease